MIVINTGATANDGTGDKLRDAFIIVNQNFLDIQDILDVVLTDSSIIPISQISGLQTILDDLSYQVSLIPGLQDDINSINSTIFTINQTLNSQNSSINELYSLVNDLQQQIFTKIGEAPIDGQQYVRQDAEWVVSTGGGGTGSYLPLAGGTMSADADIFFANGSKLSEGIVDAQTGGNKGIALTCAVGYEWKFEAGEAYLTNLSGNFITIKDYARNLPTVNDDITKGYAVGSYWRIDSQFYNCLDATEGAAVWVQATNFGNLQQVTDNGSTTTNSITADGGFFTTWADGSFQADPNSLSYSKSQIVDDEDRQVNFSIEPGNGLSTSYTNNTTELTSYINLKNDVSLGITQTIDDVTISNYLTVATTETLTPKKIITYQGFEGNYLQFLGLTNSGRFTWNDADGTADLTLKGGNVTLQIGQEQLVRVVNKTATNITLQESAYQAVRITGAQGQRLKVDLALATTDALSAETIGLVTETIANNQEGFVTISGLVRNINTTGSLQSETWNDGDILYLSPTTAGRITNIKPSAPNHMVIIGYVVYAHSNNGKIFVKVNNGYELDELHNVNIVSATAGQVLGYTPATDLWENKNLIDILDDFNKNRGIYFFENFLGTNDSAGIGTSTGVTIGAAGTGAINRITGVYPNRTNQQGVLLLATGTTTTGSGSFRLGSTNAHPFFIGSGAISYEVYVNIETLSTLANRFVSIFGLYTGVNALSSLNAIFFLYDEGGTWAFNGVPASPNWRCVTVSASTRTVTATSVAVTASAWTKLRIEVNANGTSVGFYINDVLAATNTTNIPLTTTAMYFYNLIAKSTGTTSVQMFADYLSFKQTFTNPR